MEAVSKQACRVLRLFGNPTSKVISTVGPEQEYFLVDKALYEKRPDLYVIAAGSLLESLMGRHISFPVGRVEYMALHPCTFVEFLMALGMDELARQVEDFSVPASLHTYTLGLFKKYMIVGGLPEVVSCFARYGDYVRIGDVFNSLLSGYRDDVEKYASKPKEQDAIRYILNYGWAFAGHRIQFAKYYCPLNFRVQQKN